MARLRSISARRSALHRQVPRWCPQSRELCRRRRFRNASRCGLRSSSQGRQPQPRMSLRRLLPRNRRAKHARHGPQVPSRRAPRARWPSALRQNSVRQSETATPAPTKRPRMQRGTARQRAYRRGSEDIRADWAAQDHSLRPSTNSTRHRARGRPISAAPSRPGDRRWTTLLRPSRRLTRLSMRWEPPARRTASQLLPR